MYSFIKLWFAAVIVAVVVTTVWTDHAAPVEQCPDQNFENLRDRIQVNPCGKSRCKLPRETNITVIFKFKTKQRVNTLTNSVYAEIAGIHLPFIGVSGTTACGHISHADTGEPAECPLAADKEYTYTNVFPILSLYPTVTLRVHWSLDDGDDKVICFEVPAAITKAKSRQ